MDYTRHSKFAYLRSMESQLANTRLFFGVQWETETEKAKCGYNLKVGHIGDIREEEDGVYQGAETQSVYWNQTQWGFTEEKQCFTALLLNKLYTIIGIIKEGGRQGQIRGNKVYMIYCCACFSISFHKTGGGSAIANLKKLRFFILSLHSPFAIFI